MLTRWEMVPFASAEAPDRHLLKVKGDAAGVRRLVSLFPKIAQEPFQIRGGEFDWGVYVAGASADARGQLGAYLDELIESGGEEPADEPAAALRVAPDAGSSAPVVPEPDGRDLASAIGSALHDTPTPAPARTRLTYFFPRGEETIASELSTDVAAALRRATPHVALGESELRAYDSGSPPLDGWTDWGRGGVLVVVVPAGIAPAVQRRIEQTAAAQGSICRALSSAEAARWYVRAELAGAAALASTGHA